MRQKLSRKYTRHIVRTNKNALKRMLGKDVTRIPWGLNISVIYLPKNKSPYREIRVSMARQVSGTR